VAIQKALKNRQKQKNIWGRTGWLYPDIREKAAALSLVYLQRLVQFFLEEFYQCDLLA
jgi:hypothetical protein